MTTENGLDKPSSMRKRIDRLIRRADYLEEKIDETSIGSGGRNFDEAELAALEWAIPVLEAEYDSAVRLHRLILRAASDRAAETTIERRLEHLR